VGTLKRVIESGLGWGFLPAHCIRKQVKSKRLTKIEVQELKYECDLYYYHRDDAEISPIADVFFRAIQQFSNS
jgi:DNA-binding transcriptional LysR family regulator